MANVQLTDTVGKDSQWGPLVWGTDSWGVQGATDALYWTFTKGLSDSVDTPSETLIKAFTRSLFDYPSPSDSISKDFTRGNPLVETLTGYEGNKITNDRAIYFSFGRPVINTTQLVKQISLTTNLVKQSNFTTQLVKQISFTVNVD